MNRYAMSLGALLAGLLGPAAAAEPEELTVVVGIAMTPQTLTLLPEVVAAIGREAGLRLRMVIEPGNRAKQSLLTGVHALDLVRPPDYGREVPGAIRIEPYIFNSRMVAVSRPGVPRPDGSQQFAGTSVAVTKTNTDAVELTERAARREFAVSRVACAGMAARGHVDYCVMAVAPAYPVPMEAGQPPIEIHDLRLRLNRYIFAAPGQEALAARVSAALRRMADSGELNRVAAGNRE